jgi:cytochrome c2
MSAKSRVLALSPLLMPALAVALLAAPARAGEPGRDELIAADYPQGRTAFQQRCSACHTLAEDSSNVLGPNLWQMMGRKAGGLKDYAYSPALEQSGVVWTPATLLAFISDPEGFLPGNRMMIPEPVPEADRVAMIAFVMLETGAADWPRPASAMAQDTSAAPDAPLAERFPSFWNHLMTNTTRYRLVTDGGELVFEGYFNTDGSVGTSQPGARGFWHVNERDMFCYAIYGLPIKPSQFVECFPVGAMAIPRFNPELWRSRPVEGIELYGGITPGRP